MDYLPYALYNWIVESENERTNRENFVLTFNGDENIVGFISFHFMSNRTTGTKFAFRVSNKIRGRGFGKLFSCMLDSFLLKENPRLKSVISAIPDDTMTDEEVVNQKHGDLLTVKHCHEFSLTYPELEQCIDRKVDKKLSMLSKEEFTRALKNGTFANHFENDIIHMNWVPAVINTEDDIEFITRKKQIVMVDPEDSSLSILTLPYPVPGGLRISLDVFAQDSSLLDLHLVNQLQELRQPLHSNVLTDLDQSASLKSVFLSIVVHPNMTSDLCDISRRLGLEQFRQRRGAQTREYIRMFVYQKKINQN